MTLGLDLARDERQGTDNNGSSRGLEDSDPSRPFAPSHLQHKDGCSPFQVKQSSRCCNRASWVASTNAFAQFVIGGGRDKAEFPAASILERFRQ